MPSMSIFLHFIAFLEISRNHLAALNDPPGDACSRNPNSGFSLSIAWRLKETRQAARTGLPSFLGLLMFLWC